MNVEKKSITANALMNIIKTCASIVFPLITYPYAARVLEVNDMGAIEFARSIINYVALVAGLGISTYAIREGAKVRNNKKPAVDFFVHTGWHYAYLGLGEFNIRRLWLYYGQECGPAVYRPDIDPCFGER